MNKKIIITASAIIVVGIGGWLFVSNQQKATAPGERSSTVDEVQTEKPASTTMQPKVSS